MDLALSTLLTLVGAINFAPVTGALSWRHLERLYGVDLADPVMRVLLRQRAVLFGIIGGFTLAAAWIPAWHWPAMVGAGLSMASFLAIKRHEGARSPAFRKIVLADRAGLLCLAGAVAIKLGGA